MSDLTYNIITLRRPDDTYGYLVMGTQIDSIEALRNALPKFDEYGKGPGTAYVISYPSDDEPDGNLFEPQTAQKILSDGSLGEHEQGRAFAIIVNEAGEKLELSI